MNIIFNKEIADDYKSPSQQIRVLTENWVGQSVFCPNCGNKNIDKYPNNQPVADFYCSNCNENYELKSKKGDIGSKIVNGAYNKMLDRLNSNDNPNLFILTYNFPNLEVDNFFVIPKYFFIPNIIEKRKPLLSDARRAGWIGCNIIINNIPENGKIFYIRKKKIESKENVLSIWQKTLFLKEEKNKSSKGWLLDVMRCIDKINKKEFALSEVYSFKAELEKLYPENKHIKDKIRQQLQILRDKKYLKFIGGGNYQLF